MKPNIVPHVPDADSHSAHNVLSVVMQVFVLQKRYVHQQCGSLLVGNPCGQQGHPLWALVTWH